MSDRCKDDVGTDDMRWMSRVEFGVTWESWFYSVEGSATEVFHDRTGRRRNRAVSWRVGNSEVTCYGGMVSGWRTGLLCLLGKSDSRSWKSYQGYDWFPGSEKREMRGDSLF